GLEQALLEEGVADLDRGAPLLAGLVQLQGGEGGAVDAVATGGRTHQHEQVAGAFGPRPLQMLDPDQTDAHRVHQRIARVAVVEVDLAADGGHADAVAVTADPGHDALEVTGAVGERAEAQGVEKRDRTGAHPDHVVQDPAHAGGGALVGLERGRVVVGLDLEDRGPAFADIHRPRVLARALAHTRPAAGQPPQQRPGGLVRAVLGPEHADHPQLDLVGLPAQPLHDHGVLVGRERDLAQRALVDLHAHAVKTCRPECTTEPNSLSPSTPPSSSSLQRSGWGIIPSTLPRRFVMPAIACTEPFGLAAGTTIPRSSQ